MRRRAFLLVWLVSCLVAETGFAQQTKLLFIDEMTGHPVSYVNVLVKQKGEWLMADSVGVAKVLVQGMSDLECSRVGYQPLTLSAVRWNHTKDTTIVLKPQHSLLPPATIHPVTLEMILSKIRRRLAEVPDSAIVAGSFYRQFHIENGKPVFIVEADAEVLFPKRSGKEEQLAVHHVRRMPSTEQNPEQHSDHFIDLLSLNPVAHPEGSLLNRYVGDDIRWREEVEIDEGATGNRIKLEYERVTEDGLFFETGKLVYDTTFRLMEYEYTRHLNAGFGPKYNRYRGKYAWLKLEEKLSCSYRWEGNLILLSSMHQQYTHLLFHTIFHQADYELTEDFYWQSYALRCGVPADKGRFKTQSNLYAHGITPDPSFFRDAYVRQFRPVDPVFENLFMSPAILQEKLNTP